MGKIGPNFNRTFGGFMRGRIGNWKERGIGGVMKVALDLGQANGNGKEERKGD